MGGNVRIALLLASVKFWIPSCGNLRANLSEFLDHLQLNQYLATSDGDSKSLSIRSENLKIPF